MNLEVTLEERSQAKESGDQAEKHSERLQDNTSSDAPEQRNESQSDIKKSLTSPQQSNTSGTAPDESWVEVASQTSSATDGRPTTDGESADVDEGLSAIVNLSMAPVVEAIGGSDARKSWADDDNQDLDTEIQKFSARTASPPSALSSTKPPAQECPGSPAAKLQPAIDTSVGTSLRPLPSRIATQRHCRLRHLPRLISRQLTALTARLASQSKEFNCLMECSA